MAVSFLVILHKEGLSLALTASVSGVDSRLVLYAALHLVIAGPPVGAPASFLVVVGTLEVVDMIVLEVVGVVVV